MLRPVRTRRLVVVGGGVAGLVAARAARLAARRERLPLEVVLLEAEPRLGGKVLTEVADEAVLEWGPDSFLATKPGARELAASLGLEPELVTATSAPVYLWLGGRLRALPPGLAMGVPTGLRALLGTVRHGIVGPFAALRAAAEPLLPRSPAGSVGEVARRRLGRRAATRLVEPIVAGISGAAADELDLSTCLPRLAEARSWVLTTAGRPSASASFLAPRRGMGRIVERLREEGARRVGRARGGPGPPVGRRDPGLRPRAPRAGGRGPGRAPRPPGARGASYDGPGVPDRARSGEAAGRAVVEALAAWR